MKLKIRRLRPLKKSVCWSFNIAEKKRRNNILFKFTVTRCFFPKHRISDDCSWGSVLLSPFWCLQWSLWWFWGCCLSRQSPYRWRAPRHKSLGWTNLDLWDKANRKFPFEQIQSVLSLPDWIRGRKMHVKKETVKEISSPTLCLRCEYHFCFASVCYLPGKGCRQTISSGRPSSRPSALTSSLWKSFSGSITFPWRITKERNQHLNSVGVCLGVA